MGINKSSRTAIVGRAGAGTACTLCFTVLAALVLAACGQKGSLVLPTEAAAKDRATLPQTLNPARILPSTPAPLPAAPASAAR